MWSFTFYFLYFIFNFLCWHFTLYTDILHSKLTFHILHWHFTFYTDILYITLTFYFYTDILQVTLILYILYLTFYILNFIIYILHFTVLALTSTLHHNPVSISLMDSEVILAIEKKVWVKNIGCRDSDAFKNNVHPLLPAVRWQALIW